MKNSDNQNLNDSIFNVSLDLENKVNDAKVEKVRFEETPPKESEKSLLGKIFAIKKVYVEGCQAMALLTK